eukprot:g11458.t1
MGNPGHGTAFRDWCCDRGCRVPADADRLRFTGVDWNFLMLQPEMRAGYANGYTNHGYACAADYTGTRQHVLSLPPQFLCPAPGGGAATFAGSCDRPRCVCSNGTPNSNVDTCTGIGKQNCGHCSGGFGLRTLLSVDGANEKTCWKLCSAVSCSDFDNESTPKRWFHKKSERVTAVKLHGKNGDERIKIGFGDQETHSIVLSTTPTCYDLPADTYVGVGEEFTIRFENDDWDVRDVYVTDQVDNSDDPDRQPFLIKSPGQSHGPDCPTFNTPGLDCDAVHNGNLAWGITYTLSPKGNWSGTLPPTPYVAARNENGYANRIDYVNVLNQEQLYPNSSSRGYGNASAAWSNGAVGRKGGVNGYEPEDYTMATHERVLTNDSESLTPEECCTRGTQCGGLFLLESNFGEPTRVENLHRYAEESPRQGRNWCQTLNRYGEPKSVLTALPSSGLAEDLEPAWAVSQLPTDCVQQIGQNYEGGDLVVLDGYGYVECAHLCAAARGADEAEICVGFSVSLPTASPQTCRLKSNLHNPPATDAQRISLQMTEACRAALENSDEPICETYYNENRAQGGYMRDVDGVTDMEECQPLCAADPTCQGFVLTTYNSKCWLMNHWTGINGTFRSENGVHSMRMLPTCRDKITARTPCLLEESTKRPGITLVNYTSFHLEQCKRTCASQVNCEGPVTGPVPRVPAPA